MQEQAGAVKFKGQPMTLVGTPVKKGAKAPDFAVTANDLSSKCLADFKGKVLIVSTVPSLDTGVCATQTRHFNKEAASLTDDIVILTVSMDLPFAQKRWCGAEGVDKVVTASDYKDHGFGMAWGLRIKELGLLARSVSVVDRNGTIIYHQLVNEVTEEPDYDPAIAAAKQAV